MVQPPSLLFDQHNEYYKCLPTHPTTTTTHHSCSMAISPHFCLINHHDHPSLLFDHHPTPLSFDQHKKYYKCLPTHSATMTSHHSCLTATSLHSCLINRHNYPSLMFNCHPTSLSFEQYNKHYECLPIHSTTTTAHHSCLAFFFVLTATTIGK